MKVKDCMCQEVYWCNPNSTVKDCVTMMNDNHVGCIPVCDDTKNVVGLVTDRDIVLRTIACNKDVNTTPISEIMTTKVWCCTPDTDVQEAENLMSQNQVRRIPVVDNNKIVGMLTLGDLAANENCCNQKLNDTMNNIFGCDEKNAE